MSTKANATIEDLSRTPDNQKAEIINGELVLLSPTGIAPNYAGGEIFASLRAYCRRTGLGRAATDNAGFRVDLPHRESLSPDAALYVGEARGMKFFEGAPAFAAEVRSENDDGPPAERDCLTENPGLLRGGDIGSVGRPSSGNGYRQSVPVE